MNDSQLVQMSSISVWKDYKSRMNIHRIKDENSFSPNQVRRDIVINYIR